MGRLIRLLFEDPQSFLIILSVLPYLVTTVLTVLIAIAIWTKRWTPDRTMIMVGAVLSTIGFVVNNLIHYVLLPNYGGSFYQDYIFAIQANGVIGAIGHLLFTWGLYRYFMQTPKSVANTGTQETFDPFITRND